MKFFGFFLRLRCNFSFVHFNLTNNPFSLGLKEGCATTPHHNDPPPLCPNLQITFQLFKVCSGRNSHIKRQLWDFKIVGDFLLRSTVKSIKKIVWDFKKSGSLYVWEFDMNRPLGRCTLPKKRNSSPFHLKLPDWVQTGNVFHFYPYWVLQLNSQWKKFTFCGYGATT